MAVVNVVDVIRGRNIRSVVALVVVKVVVSFVKLFRDWGLMWVRAKRSGNLLPLRR